VTDIVILGGGLAGLSVAYHLRKKYQLFEKEERVGGLCRSHQVRGFTFDYTGHLLHFRSAYAKDFAYRLLGNNIKAHNRRAWIFSKNVFTRYPFQANTYGLPPEVIAECLLGFIESIKKSTSLPPANNFKEWILQQFGSGIARHFMLPYNRKLWTIPLEAISLDWLKSFVPRPSITEVIKGALTARHSSLGYNVKFYYPKQGGIESLIKAIKSNLRNTFTNHEAKKIDLDAKRIYFCNGEKANYTKLVSTIPLPELIAISSPIPDDVKKAAEKLKYCSVYNLNLGLKGKRHGDKHWIYFPEKDIVFYRVGFNSSFCPKTAPPGQSAIYVEVSYSAAKPLNKKKIRERIRADLIKVGIINRLSDIVAELPLDIKYGYVIFDHQRKKRVETIQSFLNSQNICTLGRFGSWSYQTMEDAILAGSNVAQSINKADK
jgi:protoporphyrinogen oxidase